MPFLLLAACIHQNSHSISTRAEVARVPPWHDVADFLSGEEEAQAVCRKQALHRDAHATGLVRVVFDVSDGVVKTSYVAENSTNDDILGACLDGIVADAVFDSAFVGRYRVSWTLAK